MDGIHFDALTRQTRRLSRKTSLKLLGGSVAALVAARPLAGEAKKSCGKKCRGKCEKQVAPCKEYWTGFCDEDDECRAYFHGCCESLKSCNGNAYFACVDVRQ